MCTKASLSLDKTLHDFGSPTLNSTTTQTVILTNSGETKATALSFSGLKTPYTIDSSACGTEVAAESSCHFTVTYAPTIDVTYEDTLTIAYNDGSFSLLSLLSGTTKSFSLTVMGEVTTLGSVNLSATTHGFASKDQGTSTSKTFTLSNPGETKAKTLSFTGLEAPYTINSTACGTEIAASGTCDVIVTYVPTTAGNHTDSLTIAYNDGEADQSQTLPLTGNGKTVASIALSATTHTFGAKRFLDQSSGQCLAAQDSVQVIFNQRHLGKCCSHNTLPKFKFLA